jgi:hypothetical protein
VTRNGVSYRIETQKLKRTTATPPLTLPQSKNHLNGMAANTQTGGPDIVPGGRQQKPVGQPDQSETQLTAIGHRYVLEEDQPQPCPQCGEQRVRGVNGSQRWCIGCGANWPTATTFLNEVAAAHNPQPDRLRRELGRRFNNLLQRLSAPQLVQVERQLFDLEQQLAAPVSAVN